MRKPTTNLYSKRYLPRSVNLRHRVMKAVLRGSETLLIFMYNRLSLKRKEDASLGYLGPSKKKL